MDQDTAARRLLKNVVEAHGAGEARPQQARMVDLVSKSIEDRTNALIQAGTGVGKSLGYLIPTVTANQRAIISTATKQLSEQVANMDIPFLRQVVADSGGKPFSTAILKGRANYVCLRKVNGITELDEEAQTRSGGVQDSLIDSFDDDDNTAVGDNSADTVDESFDPDNPVSLARKVGKDVSSVIDFVENNPATTGDRTVLPVVINQAWDQVSATPAQCIGASKCPFASDCFSERARREARDAQIVVTNHALAATELSDRESERWNVLGERDVVIFDEVHELDGSLSDAWGCTLSPKVIRDFVRSARQDIPATETDVRQYITEIEAQADNLEGALAQEGESRRVTAWESEYLNVIRTLLIGVAKISAHLTAASAGNDRLLILSNECDTLADSLIILSDEGTETVQWIEKDRERSVMRAAPLRVGPRLMEALRSRGTTMIATSATISVGGNFDIPARNFALDETGEYIAEDVGTPFDYPRQGILYIPEPSDFPAPIGKERFEHTDAVLEELVKIVNAAGGRTLALSTTSVGAKRMAEHLRENTNFTVLSHLDATPGVLAERFAEDETSVLCATMGMWHGLNVPGKSLSAVVIDKIPFPPMGDPLMASRQEDVETRGGNGFMDVYVAQATTMLAQGAGRLIRHTSDRGMVAILDVRLRTKRYGSTILRSLPDMWRTGNIDTATSALKRALG